MTKQTPQGATSTASDAAIGKSVGTQSLDFTALDIAHTQLGQDLTQLRTMMSGMAGPQCDVQPVVDFLDGQLMRDYQAVQDTYIPLGQQYQVGWTPQGAGRFGEGAAPR